MVNPVAGGIPLGLAAARPGRGAVETVAVGHDAVQLGTRPLWLEAAQKGWLAAGASVPGVIGPALAEVIQELEANGVTLFGSLQAPEGMRATGHGMQDVEIKTLRDLRMLDAFYGRKDDAALGHAACLDALRHLQSCGVAFELTSPTAGAGLFGAWRYIFDTKPEGRYLFIRTPTANGGSRSERLDKEEDAVFIDFFDMDGDANNLSHPQLGETVRMLAKQHYTFHDRYEVKPKDAYLKLVEDPTRDIEVGVYGVAVTRVPRQLLDRPESYPADLREARQYFDEGMARQLRPWDTKRLLELAWSGRNDAPEFTRLPRAERWRLVLALHDAESVMADRDVVYRIGEDLALIQKAGGDFALDCEVFAALVRSMGSDDARKGLAFMHTALRARALDAAQYAVDARRFADLASHMGEFESARRAWELLQSGASEPWEDALHAVRLLVDTETPFGHGGYRRTGNGGSYTWSSADRTPQNIGKSPTERVLGDIEAVMMYRQQPIREAASMLCILHQVLTPVEGWETTVNTFIHLQRGLASGRYGSRTGPELMTRFTSHYLLKRDLESAKRHLAAEDKPAGDIQHADQHVTIDGVSVPVRNH